MIKEGAIVYRHPVEGTYILPSFGQVTKDYGPYSEVEAYLAEHPEALIHEPVPPEPTQEELDAHAVQASKSYLSSTDWIIAKIGEAQMKGLDIALLLTEYADDIHKREEARIKINELDK